MSRLLAAALAASGVAAVVQGGTPAPAGVAGQPPRAQASVAPSARRAAAALGGRVSSSIWPGIVSEAMGLVRTRSLVPLEAPRLLPRLPGGRPYSAQVVARRASYFVRLFGCSRPLPLNSPGIGRGACGGLAAFAGGFGGRSYRDASDAAEVLESTSRVVLPKACHERRRVALRRGPVVVLRYGPPPASSCEARFSEHGLVVVFDGDLNGGVAGDRTIPWTVIAEEVVAALRAHSIDAAEGDVLCDISGDGLHSEVSIRLGADLYTVSDLHSVLRAVEIAAALRQYPASAGA